MKKVLIVGSINQDVVVGTDTFAQPGETVFGNSLQYFLGGKGANQAIACKIIYENTHFYGVVGDDVFGKDLLSQMREYDLESLLSTEDTLSTGTAIITVDGSGENMITVVGGANNSVLFENIGFLCELQQGDCLLLQNEIPQDENIKLLERAKDKGIITFYNPAPSRKLSSDELGLIDYLILNESEFEFILGKQATLSNIKNIVVDMHKKYGLKVVVTLGSQGVVTYNKGEVLSLPAIDITPVDTTGAGDCFSGTLVGYLASGETFKTSLQKATIASGLSVTRSGASNSYYTKKKIESFTI